MIKFDDQFEADIWHLYAEQNGLFDRLVAAAGLKPERDFRYRDLTNLRLEGADLRRFDFTGSDLRGTGIRFAKHYDASTILSQTLLDSDDAMWKADRENVIASNYDQLVCDIRTALHNREFDLRYQPKLHLRRRVCTAFEVLLRWNHPELGVISPASFIPILENEGLIGDVTYWIIESALSHRRKVREAGLDIRFDINVASEVFLKPDFVFNLENLIVNGRGMIGVEVNESVFIYDEKMAHSTMHGLSRLGIPVIIDNYGANYSFLPSLKDAPSSQLKIDRVLISNIISDNKAPLMVRSIIDLAHGLEMEVVAEGVETPAQLALLTVMGCDLAQGFFISRPLEFPDLLNWIQESSFSDMLERITPKHLR